MKYQLLRIFNVIFFTTSIFLISSCESEEVVKEITVVAGGETATGGDEFKTTGFIVSSFSSTSGGDVTFASYLENKPAGNIDLSQNTAFSQFNPIEVYKNYSFGRPFDTDFGLSRYSVNEETGAIEEKTIITNASLSAVKIISDELGLYTINEVKKLFVFNPTTMEFIREIDMPNAKSVDVYFTYLEIIYRKQDNKAFMFLHINDQDTGAFYDANEIYIEVINLNSFSWESTTTLTDAQYPFTRGATNNIVDEFGNIYITCQGSYSLDGQSGPSAAIASRPQIVKIPSGSTVIDPDYRFNPVNYLGFTNLIAQFITGTVYGADGIAYAAVSAKDDDPRIIELATKIFLGTITSEEFGELRNLVINGPNFKWTKLDLNAQTATVISDIPFTAGYAYPYAYNYDGKLLFQAFNSDQGLNGYYEYDPETDTSFNIFNVTGGGIATQLIKLQE